MALFGNQHFKTTKNFQSSGFAEYDSDLLEFRFKICSALSENKLVNDIVIGKCIHGVFLCNL